MIAYIDDTLVKAESRELLVNQAAGMCYLLKNLGFLINQKKSILEPSQTMEFLGFTVDTVVMEIKLPSDKLKKIRVESWRLEKEEVVSARSLARLIWKMNAISWVIPSAPLFYRHLQMKLSLALNKSLQDYETRLTLDQEYKNELRWWDNIWAGGTGRHC